MAIEGMGEAVRAVQRDADDALDWLTPVGEKNLLGPDIAIAFAGLLVMSFLSGFQSAAVEKSKDFGKKTFEWLSNRISELASGKKGPPSKEVEDLAQQAPKTAAALSADDFELAVVRTRDQLVVVLKAANLPHDRASRIAISVSDAAIKDVLKRGKHR